MTLMVWRTGGRIELPAHPAKGAAAMAGTSEATVRMLLIRPCYIKI